MTSELLSWFLALQVWILRILLLCYRRKLGILPGERSSKSLLLRTGHGQQVEELYHWPHPLLARPWIQLLLMTSRSPPRLKQLMTGFLLSSPTAVLEDSASDAGRNGHLVIAVPLPPSSTPCRKIGLYVKMILMILTASVHMVHIQTTPPRSAWLCQLQPLPVHWLLILCNSWVCWPTVQYSS